jgi:glycosyltransferase involved in cell wall biosynthesis
MKVSVIVPVYRSADLIEDFYSCIVKLLRELGCSFEILFEVDGNPDHSGEVLTHISKRDRFLKLNLRNKNRGLGFTLRNLIGRSQGDYVLYLNVDAFKCFDLSYLHKFISLMENYDVVIANRYGDAPHWVPFYRLIISRLYYCLNHILLSCSVCDISSGFQLYSGPILRSLNLISSGFDIYLEIYLKLILKGAKIIEVSVPYRHYPRGTFSLLAHGPAIFFRTMVWYNRYWRGMVK